MRNLFKAISILSFILAIIFLGLLINDCSEQEGILKSVYTESNIQYKNTNKFATAYVISQTYTHLIFSTLFLLVSIAASSILNFLSKE